MKRDRIPIIAMHPVTHRVVFEFDSIQAASLKFGCQSSAVSTALSKGRIFKGYKFIKKETLVKVGGNLSSGANPSFLKSFHDSKDYK